MVERQAAAALAVVAVIGACAMAGAVGMDVISPMPMAPQATFSPGLSMTMALISGI